MNKLLVPFVIVTIAIGSTFLFSADSYISTNQLPDIHQQRLAASEKQGATVALTAKNKSNSLLAVISSVNGQEQESEWSEDEIQYSDHRLEPEQPSLTDDEIMEQSTAVSESEPDVEGNEKPIINKSVQQSLQNMIYQWDFTEGNPANYSLDIDGLFNDAENDLLTFTAQVNSVSLRASTLMDSVQLSGSVPSPEESELVLNIAAKDNFHDDEEDPWTVAQFTLPNIDEAQEDDSHPLIGHTFYYIGSSNYLGNRVFAYQVAYCQAVMFVNGRMFYAASANKNSCPNQTELRSIGTYTLNEEILTANNALEQSSQIWTVKYQQTFSDTDKDIIVTVSQSAQSDTYLLQSLKRSTEQRLFPTTKLQQLNYYFPLADGNYVPGTINLHLDKYHTPQSSNGELYDADVNINLSGYSLSCEMIEPYFDNFTFAGIDIYGDLISSVGITNPIGCREYSMVNQATTVFIDFNFEMLTELIDGEIYSIIGQVKEPYRSAWEDIKLNAYWVRENNIFSLE